jgi:FAD/FMN-containing dehydrogenase
MTTAIPWQFAAEFVLRGSDAYEDARVGRVFNGRRPERFPEAVLFAESSADVAAGVRLAAERGWRVAVRAGGHSWAAWSVRDDALLIDLGRMREIALNPATGVVRVSPGIKGGTELNPYLATHGRFFPGGHCPTVGLGGFLLQGGQGWNARGWKWAAEHIVAVDVVTADGELVRADASSNSDLYWAARGAGPGFPGVVTRFHLSTLPLPGHLAHTAHLYPMHLFDEVMEWLQGIHGSVSSAVEIVAVGMSMPPGVETGGYDGPVLAVTGLAFTDTAAEGAEALAPLETCPVIDQALVRDSARPTTLAEQLVQQIRMNPEGHRYVVDNAWLTGEPAQVVPAIRGAFAELPTPGSFSIWFSMAPLRELPDMAFSLQTEIYFASYVVCTDESEDERCREWLAGQMAAIEPVSAGQYLGDSDFATREAKFMADPNWSRLQEIRARRDPNGLFVGYLTAGEPARNASPREY